MSLHTTDRFILASGSPRRSELLKLLGLRFEIIPSAIDETFLAGEEPQEHVRRLAAEKTLAVSRCHPDAWVLGADTIVIIEGIVLGKPRTPDEVKTMLGKLSGKEHAVFTGYAVSRSAENILVSDCHCSSVLFKEISGEEMDWYATSEEPYDKAGGYAVQGASAFFIREIHGSYTNVMGLPLCEVIHTLISLGAITFGKDLHGLINT